MKKKLTGQFACMMENIQKNYDKHVAENKANSQSKYGFVQKVGVNIPFLRPSRFAKLFDVSLKTLERWRHEGGGPPYVKTPNGHIRYYIRELDNWCDKHMVISENL